MDAIRALLDAASAAETSTKLVQAGGELQATLSQHGPSCPCVLVYIVDDKVLPAQWAVDRGNDMCESDKLLIPLNDPRCEGKECCICRDGFDRDHLPIRTICCGNLIGQECMQTWVASDDLTGACMLVNAEQDFKAPKGCPLCRTRLFWYPRHDDGTFDWYIISRLQDLYDNLTIQFSEFTPADNAQVLVHPTLMLQLHRYLGSRHINCLAEEHVEEQLNGLAIQSGSRELVIPTMSAALLLSVLQVTDAFQGETINVEELITILWSRFLRCLSSRLPSEALGIRLAFYRNVVRFIVLKWWIACHITDLMSTAASFWGMHAGDRGPADFGASNQAFVPSLPPPFSDMPELVWLKLHLVKVNLHLETVNLLPHEQESRRIALVNYRRIVRQLFDRPDVPLPDQDKLTLGARLLDIQTAFQRLLNISCIMSAYDPITRTIARPADNGTGEVDGIALYLESGERLVSGMNFIRVFETVIAGRYDDLFDPDFCHCRFRRVMADARGEEFPLSEEITEADLKILRDRRRPTDERRQTYVEAHGLDSNDMPGFLNEAIDWEVTSRPWGSPFSADSLPDE